MTRFLLRAVVGGVVGIFIGENPILIGLLTSPLFVPMLIWYVFLFATFDWLIVRLGLSSGGFFLLAAIFGIVIGGILDREYFAASPEMGLLGLEVLVVVLVTLWWGASFVLLFHLMDAFLPRHGAFWGAWAAVVFVALTLLFMGGGLPEVIASVNPVGMLLLLVLTAFLLFWLLRLRRARGQVTRPMLRKDGRLVAIPLLFIVLSPLPGAEGYLYLSALLVVIVLLGMWRYQIAV